MVFSLKWTLSQFMNCDSSHYLHLHAIGPVKVHDCDLASVHDSVRKN